MIHRKCGSCHNGCNHLNCTWRYMFCEICLDLNRHGSTKEHYLKTFDNHDSIICARCMCSFKRIYKFIDKGIINNDENEPYI